ncbi:MAG: type II toxin-antitoxin system ParD family antitoxin [Pseudanabaena frigida]|uniref:Type II toxin-antitoxin system ParD family antitoxin n=1 Tax=Pseudanabaena frigida TaxID=945775 RepID=A0A2W4WBB9_9CYAN|nr:MAG: type II toxin-antitoxin system ParD family antitoxin [Pseudanabaena frigida]
MNVSFPIPKELESYVQEQIHSGTYNTVEDYFLALLNQDRQRREAQVKLVSLLQEGENSEAELVTSTYWQDLRL